MHWCMLMNKITLSAIAICVLSVAEAGDFEIKSAAPLSVTYKGVPLITGETFGSVQLADCMDPAEVFTCDKPIDSKCSCKRRFASRRS